MPNSPADLAANRARIRAIPMFGDGPIPPERDRRVEDDDKSFREVLLLFLRSWPYIRPQFLGRWLIPSEGVEQRVAETVSGGYQVTYAPFLVATVALLGPFLGVVPATLAWPMNLLYPPIVVLVLSTFALAFSTGRRQMIATVGLVLSGLGTNISATFFIDGYADSFYAAPSPSPPSSAGCASSASTRDGSRCASGWARTSSTSTPSTSRSVSSP